MVKLREQNSLSTSSKTMSGFNLRSLKIERNKNAITLGKHYERKLDLGPRGTYATTKLKKCFVRLNRFEKTYGVSDNMSNNGVPPPDGANRTTTPQAAQMPNQQSAPPLAAKPLAITMKTKRCSIRLRRYAHMTLDRFDENLQNCNKIKSFVPVKPIKAAEQQTVSPLMKLQPSTQKTPTNTKTKNCCVRVKRYTQKKLARPSLTSDPVGLHDLWKGPVENKCKENTGKHFDENLSNGNNKRKAIQSSTTLVHEKNNNLVMTTSTPRKASVSYQREPFKELNVQFGANTLYSVEKSLILKGNRENLKKLSLTKPRMQQSSLKKYNDFLDFEPLRNSTRFETNVKGTTSIFERFEKTPKEPEIFNKSTDIVSEMNQNSSSKDLSSRTRNLANKSDLIEQLILSDDNAEENLCNVRLRESNSNTADQPKPNSAMVGPTQPNSDDVDQPKLNSDQAKLNSEQARVNIDQPTSKSAQRQPCSSAVTNTTHKFFHRDRDNVKPSVVSSPKVNPVKKVSNKNKERRVTKRGKKFSAGNVYDFLSQSQTPDSDTADKQCDPTADIIAKLITEGKVSVATHKKGSGKLRMKRKNVPKKRAIVLPKPKKTTSTKVVKNAGQEKQKDFDNEFPQVDYGSSNDFPQDDGAESADQPNNMLEEPLPPQKKTISFHPVEEKLKPPLNSKPDQATLSSGGVFSNLARSVLISEAERKEKASPKATYQRKLLDAARKFVSTPVSKKLNLNKTANISPILAQKPAPESASPWRVNDDSHLPSVFYFSRNSDNLPSFSSDCIPLTPREQSPEMVPYQDLPSTAPSTADPVSTLQDDQAQSSTLPAATNRSFSLSSFSSNDSNAENMPPPPPVGPDILTATANDEAINRRQQLNPLRGYSNRSPLKNINILEVITLPPWNKEKINTNPVTADGVDEGASSSTVMAVQQKTPENDISKVISLPSTNKGKINTNPAAPDGADEDASSTTSMAVIQKTPKKDISKVISLPSTNKRKINTNPAAQDGVDEGASSSTSEAVQQQTLKNDILDLFGFKEYLDDTDVEEQLQQQQLEWINELESKEGCNSYLQQKLRELRRWRPLDEEIMKTCNTKPIKAVFDDGANDGRKQLQIKDMFCSTMINRDKAEAEQIAKQADGPKDSGNDAVQKISPLFADTEPELSFNLKEPRRTYGCPYKRKKKLRHNFVMFLDSDDSGDEEEFHKDSSYEEEEGHKKKRKKKHRMEDKQNEELESFVKDFNKMCKEVDQYKLIVE